MKLERQDQVGILYVDTDRNNAINDEFIREAHQLMDAAEHDPGIRALVVTSTHKTIFCPGVDLPPLTGRSAPEMRRFYEALTGIVRRKVAYPKPEVYALNGHTIASEAARTDRSIGLAKFQWARVHAHQLYDLEVDTSTQSPEECAGHISTYLRAGQVPTAFRRLRDGLGVVGSPCRA